MGKILKMYIDNNLKRSLKVRFPSDDATWILKFLFYEDYPRSCMVVVNSYIPWQPGDYNLFKDRFVLHHRNYFCSEWYFTEEWPQTLCHSVLKRSRKLGQFSGNKLSMTIFLFNVSAVILESSKLQQGLRFWHQLKTLLIWTASKYFRGRYLIRLS